MVSRDPNGHATGLHHKPCGTPIKLVFVRVFDAGYDGYWALVCEKSRLGPHCLHIPINAAQLTALETALAHHDRTQIKQVVYSVLQQHGGK